MMSNEIISIFSFKYAKLKKNIFIKKRTSISCQNNKPILLKGQLLHFPWKKNNNLINPKWLLQMKQKMTYFFPSSCIYYQQSVNEKQLQWKTLWGFFKCGSAQYRIANASVWSTERTNLQETNLLNEYLSIKKEKLVCRIIFLYEIHLNMNTSIRR